MKWEPIETAPRDRVKMLLYFPRIGIVTGHRGKPERRWNGTSVIEVDTWLVSYWINYDFPRTNPPTHWMPLPEPPTP